ncbi:hypothetical protein QJS04_geneDACA002816 [Acorus gramineus]|uniref:Uncharacterized protein n=1 Tax=Acorus gramineus TaxID=55184 RepID=A0AAV9BXL4_ACOGR|nr:hypothetical protein QJS04_geneDACA002816 [Acorus gramineus]
MECCSDFVAWMTSFCRKKIATEFTVEHVNNLGSKCERILQPNHGSFLPHSMPNIECIISGLEDYVLKHEHILDKECQSCFSCREHLKVGSGAASSTDVLKDTGQMVEAVIVVAEAQKSVNMLCSRSFSPATEIRGCAPDLSRAIAGLILSSNDSHFQKECASTLGLCPLEVLKEGKVESCIREKIIGIIEMNDRKSKSKGGGDCAPCLFECESFNEEDYPGEENEEVEEDVSMLNL